MLYEYQKNVLENSQKNYLYSLDTGTGKTLIALHHYYKYAAGRQLIIIAPAQKVKEIQYAHTKYRMYMVQGSTPVQRLLCSAD